MGSNTNSGSQAVPIGVTFPFVSTDTDHVGQDCDETERSLPGDQDRSALAIKRMGEYPVAFGGQSDVWRAKWTRNGCETYVALKVLRCPGADKARLYKRLQREVTCWKPLNHKNIAPFHSVHYLSNGAPAIILPWYNNGSADVYLRKYTNINPITIIREIASGIEYLHARGIIHGDLKGANVMIDDAGHARLIDFGLARLMDAEDDFSTSTTSSIRWCAPELRRTPDARTSTASDVYAFASTVLELVTGAVPYAKLPTTAVYREVINGVSPRRWSYDIRRDVDISRPELLWRLLARCWAEPARRPAIREVKKTLRLFAA